MKELLRPSGVLVCLEFPLHGELNLPRPPGGFQNVYQSVLGEGGDGNAHGVKEAVRGGSGGLFTRVAYINPAQSYDMGRGRNNMLSVWALKR